jgi:hypothetical protein
MMPYFAAPFVADFVKANLCHVIHSLETGR